MKLAPLPPADEPALVAVSGGRDSVALLHALVACGFSRLTVVHLDHALRAESRADVKFVRALAKKLGVAFVSKRMDVAAIAKRTKLSIESAARKVRLVFFRSVARRKNCRRVFLAHHADDQAETFLLNLLRGAGPGGLAAMAPVSTFRIMSGLLDLYRPLLGVWREEIDAYVRKHGIEFREDASNATMQFARNRLRHDALPALSRALDRDVRGALWRAAEIFRAEDEFVASQVPATAPQLSVQNLRALPLALQRRRIYEWLRWNEVSTGFAEVETVRSLIEGPRAKVNLPGDRHARRRAGVLWIE